MNRTASIEVRWTFEGWHRWPSAPAHRDYLAVRHRHLFHGTVSVTVAHDDREVEFHDLLDVARASTVRREWGDASCETICDVVAGKVRAQWPGRPVTVSVFEDGECGAKVLWEP